MASDEGKMIFESSSSTNIGHSVEVTGRHCTVIILMIKKMTLIKHINDNYDDDEQRNNQRSTDGNSVEVTGHPCTVKIIIIMERILVENMMMEIILTKMIS